MTVPAWLSDSLKSPGDFSEALAADVETGGVGMISTVRTKTALAGWTEPSANLFKSVPTAAGAWFDVLMTRIDADTMEFRVRDHNGATIITRRIDIEAAGNTTVDYFWGVDYLIIWSKRATAEVFIVGLLDPTAVGCVDADILNRYVANAHRTTAGAASSIVNGTFFALDNGVATSASRKSTPGTDSAGNVLGGVAVGTRLIFRPQIIRINQAGTNQWTGAFPMGVECDSSLAFDLVKKVPVDTGTLRAFVVLPFVTNSGARLMIRKPSAD